MLFFMPVPSALIQPIRAALATQGFPGQSITDSGEVDPGALLGGAFSKITLMSRLTPPIPINTVDALSTQTPTGLWPRLIQPAVVFEGRSGKFTYAPYGNPGAQQGWLWATAIVLGLIGFGYLLGRSKR